MNVAGDIDDANFVVGGVGNIYISRGIGPDTTGRVDLRQACRTAIAGTAGRTRSGYEIEQTSGDADFEHFVAVIACDVDVALSIGRNATGLVETHLRGDAARSG